MKKLISVLVMLAIIVGANAEILFTENFESYTTGSSVSGKSTWTTHSGTVGQITVDSSTGTNAAGLTGAESEDINATFTEVTDGILSTTMDVYVTNALTGNYFFHFKPTLTTNFFYKGRVTIITNGTGGFNFGLAYSDSSPAITTTTGYNLNQWYSLKVDLNWFNKSCTLTVLSSGESISDGNAYTVDPMNAIALRQASSCGDILVDNFVVSYSPYDPNEPNEPNAVYTYNWEDGIGDIVYSYGNVYKPQNTTETVYAGSHALKVTHYPISSGQSSKASLAWVKNLQTGDTVTARVRAYDDPLIGGEFHGARLVADYTSSVDINDFFGYVSGYSAYTIGLGWEQLEYTWTASTLGGTQDSMLVAVQLSSNSASTSEDFYFDNFELIVPEHAEVVLPPVMDPNLYDTYTYGWENFDPTNPAFRETVLLGTKNSIQTGLEITEVHSGTKSLWISEDGTVDTGQGYAAWIKNLVPGDYIDASCFAKSYAGSTGNVSVRMWAHYTYDNADINSFAGYAAGCELYSDPNSWTEFNKRWVLPKTVTDDEGVERTPNGMVIEIRTYSAPGDGGYVDDLSITIPTSATVEFPSMTGDFICVGDFPEWDFNKDCIFNLLDLVLVIDDWLTCHRQPFDDCGI